MGGGRQATPLVPIKIGHLVPELCGDVLPPQGRRGQGDQDVPVHPESVRCTLRFQRFLHANKNLKCLMQKGVFFAPQEKVAAPAWGCGVDCEGMCVDNVPGRGGRISRREASFSLMIETKVR